MLIRVVPGVNMKKKVAIIGAGLSGLNCAKYLETNDQFEVEIFEKDSDIGGEFKQTK